MTSPLISPASRGPLSDPFYEWGPAADPGGPRAVHGAPPHPVLHWGPLYDLLRQGTVLSLQCQWTTARAHGSGGQHQGEERFLRRRACRTAFGRVCLHHILLLIKGFLTIWDLGSVGLPSGKLRLHISSTAFHTHTPEEVHLLIRGPVVRSNCISSSGREHSRGVVSSGHQRH